MGSMAAVGRRSRLTTPSSATHMIKLKDTMQDSSSLIRDLNSITNYGFTNDGERMKALAAAYALVARLETPWEFVARLCMGQVRKCIQTYIYDLSMCNDLIIRF